MSWIYGLLTLVCMGLGGVMLAIECRSRYWLAGFMLFLAAYLGLILLDAQSFYISPSLYFLLLSIIFLPGPLLLGYISHISTQSYVSFRDFLPALLPTLVVLICADLFDNGPLFETSRQQAYQSLSYIGFFNLISAMAGLSMLVYIASGVYLLFKLRSNWTQYQSRTLPNSWHKMGQVMAVTLVVSVLQVVSAFIHPSGDSMSLGDIAFIAFVVYFIALTIHTAWTNGQPQNNHTDELIDEHQAPEPQSLEASKTQEQQQQCKNIRAQVLEQGHHLNNELTLTNLAHALNMTPHKLSIAINNGLSVTFYEFINDLRIASASELLLTHPNKSITEVFFAAGFTAKSTFYSHFKKVHGMTPSQFRQRALN